MLAGSAGNLVEWYDWYVYSAFSLYFAPMFFPAIISRRNPMAVVMIVPVRGAR